jgi:hypothetical protein
MSSDSITDLLSALMILLFHLFVLGVLLAPTAVLGEFNFTLDRLAVLAAPIIDPLAGAAGELD